MREINFGGTVLSTIDWRGLNSLVLFLRGCPLRCLYCQNFKLFQEPNYVPVEDVKSRIEKELDFVDALVFSGGEPTLHEEFIEEIGTWMHNANKLVGIQTNGYFASSIKRLLKSGVIDKVFLDVKAPLRNNPLWFKVTQVSNVEKSVRSTLSLCKNSNTPLQVQTTVFKRLVSEEEVLQIAEELDNLKFNGEYVIQQGLWDNVPRYGRKLIKREDEFTPEELRIIGKKIKEQFSFPVYVRTREGEELIE